MNTIFKYKISGKSYTCDFGFRFIELACEDLKTDLDTISQDLFGIKPKATGKKDKDGNEIIETEMLPTYKLMGLSYRILYYGVSANDQLNKQPESLSLEDACRFVVGNTETLTKCYTDAYKCVLSAITGQEIKENEPKQKKSRSQPKKSKK